MICTNNDSRCIKVGYCSCRRDDMSEAAAGLGGFFFAAVVGILVSFLYPAIKILRSETEYEVNGSPKFAGNLWLFLSPLFGLLSNMLYQVIFALAACTAEALQSKVTNSIHVIGIFIIYALAIGLAVISFTFKNRKAVGLMLSVAENRTVNKILVLACTGIMGLLAVFFATGAVFTAASAYFEFGTNIRQANENDGKLIFNERGKFDSYTGKYKLTTRNDRISFLVTKNKDGKALRLNSDSGSNNKANNSGCLLTPEIEGNSIYYAVSECVVDNKPSPLMKVYFRLESNSTKMDFIYNAGLGGDTLEKIK